MSPKSFRPALTCTLLFPVAVLGQTLDTTFTYQGHLKQSGAPLTGTADLECKLFNALAGGIQIGPTLTASNVAVADGLFTIPLNLGTGAFNADQRFLELAVRSPAGSGNFTILSPRQPLTAAPYALYALSGPGSGGPWAVDGNNVFNTNLGNVGIGTTSPTHPLHIAASIPILNVQDSDSTGAQQSGYVRFTDSDNSERGWVGFGNQTSTDLGLVNNHPTGNTRLGAGAAYHVMLTSNGNVGIGTTSPQARLDVGGSVNSTGTVSAIDSSGARVQMTPNSIFYIRGNGTTGVINFSAITVRMTDRLQIASDVLTQIYPFRVGNPFQSGNGNGAHVTDGGVWTNGSDRNMKRGFEDIDKKDILEKVARLPITQWRYNCEKEGIRHIGPMAQDFKAAFGMGEDDRYIGTIDADGVALAAIQALHEESREKDRRIAEQQEQITELRERLSRLEALLTEGEGR